jgi:exosortase
MSTVDTNPPASSVTQALRVVSTPAVRDAAALFAFLSAGWFWCYWPTLTLMADRWSRDPQYSHGFLVPVFAAVLLWSRRELLSVGQPDLWGLPLLGGAMAMHVLGAVLDIEALDAYSLLPALTGLVLLGGGRAMLRWCWPGIAFLAFMLPLPFFLEMTLAHPLRRLATIVSTYTLQTFGCPALSEGNVILIDTAKLGVADACSGLGMLMTFFALATAVALVSHAPLGDRLVLVASAAPIAVFANVTRITATGMAYHWGASNPTARAILHDLAGWLMMPLALALMYLEMRFLKHLFIVEPARRPLPLNLPARTVEIKR